MNTEKQRNSSDDSFVGVSVLLGALFLVACLLGFYDSSQIQRIKRNNLQNEGRQPAIGFPATEKSLQVNKVYYVNASVVDVYPDATNYLAVMQEVNIRDSSCYSHTRNDRLFLLKKNLRSGGYYRAVRDGTNVTFEPVPPPAIIFPEENK